MLPYRELSLSDLVLYKKKLESELPEGEVLPDEVVEMAEVATQLLEGKIDQAARFRAGLMSHIEATKSQIKYLEEMLDMTEKLMMKAVEQSGQTRLDGGTYSIRVQKNGGKPATIIDPEAKIPLDLQKVVVTNVFSYTDEQMLYWARATLGRLVNWKSDLSEKEKDASPLYRLELADNERERLEKLFKFEPSKQAIAEALTKDPKAVPGCRLERGSHLRVEAGKALPKGV
jgi:hypothetical protein